MNIKNGKIMNREEKKKIIIDFINGPLREYFDGEISFGKFKERINEKFDTDFNYSDLYPSYLFNAQLTYPEEEIHLRSDLEKIGREYEERLKQCHAYGLCASGDYYMFSCKICPKHTKDK